jgi:alginate O-acetyltransferase complex protein AlgJ
MRVIQWLRIGTFVAAIVLPLATMRDPSAALAHEQRARVARPQLAVAGSRYPDEFDAYFRDSFGWRSQLIRWHNTFKFRFLAQSPVTNVIVGRKGWLFYAGEGDGVDIRDFSGRWAHTTAMVDRWLTEQEQRRIFYQRQGARYLIALVPNKQTVYPDYVPLRYGPHAPGVFDSVMRERAARFPELDILDLRPVLATRREPPPFYKGDSHWNANGAFLAATAITDHLRQVLPNTGTLRRADYSITTRPIDTGDLVRMLGLDIALDDVAYDYQRLTPGVENVQNEDLHRRWRQKDRALPTAVLLGDSFGGELAPRLADAFSSLHYYYSMRGGFDPNLVSQDSADTVILLLVERYLPHLETQ